MKRSIPFHSNAVWPSPGLVATFLFFYGLVSVCLWLIESNSRRPGEAIFDVDDFLNIRAKVLTIAAVAYAVGRLWRFHPACNRAYAGWLRSSPWTPDKPLPLGPIHLVWQDVVVIGVLTAIAAWNGQFSPTSQVVAFGAVYLIGMTLLLAFTRRWWSCLLLGFLWPAVMLPRVEGWPTVLIVVAIIGVIWHGHRQCLRAFPWESARMPGRPAESTLQMEIRLEPLGDSPATGNPNAVGWPFLALSPKIHFRSISLLTGVLLGALIGWWSFCAIVCFEIEPLPELILFYAFLAVVFRLARYCSGVAPPFNVWGRIAAGRIIVPGFDKVFLAPLAAVLVAVVGGMIIRRSGSWYPVAESCVMALITCVLFCGGPTLRNWMLTGQHRLRIPARLGANKEMLRSI